MPHYLFQVSYTTEGVANLVRSPQNRFEVVRPVVERLGGRVTGNWFSFGDYDVVLIAEMPDNTAAVSFAMAVSAGGAVRACKTTPLLTGEEAIEAMKKAGTAGYQPPR